MARIPLFDRLPATGRRSALMRICVFAIAVVLERRSVARGTRARVRHVDARTGAAPSLRQTIVLLGSRDAIRWLFDRAIPGSGAALRRAQPEWQRELVRVRAQYPDGSSAQQDAVMRLYETGQAPTYSWRPGLIRVAVVTVVNRCPVPFRAERRTLPDLLAGTKSMRNGPSRWRRLLRR
jgi:hypothetical protein